MKPWLAYTDGASRGNPGPAGCGVEILSPDGRRFLTKAFLGKKTNNQAEYEAVILALKELGRLAARIVLIRADSQLLVKQMNGEYQVKNANILPLYHRVRELCEGFGRVRFEHVRREDNKPADRLANEAIDEQMRAGS